jgi:light-independent protochlorophyllide reductase subunit L
MFEMGDEPDVLAVQEVYRSLARQLLAGTDGLTPEPLGDNDLFNLLGYD